MSQRITLSLSASSAQCLVILCRVIIELFDRLPHAFYNSPLCGYKNIIPFRAARVKAVARNV